MDDILVEFKGFGFQYTAQSKPTLYDIDLTVRRGEKILIAGPSGCGKSTLAHCINGFIPFSMSGEMTGSCLVGGRETRKMSIFELSHIVGTVLQDSDGQFIGLTVAEDIAFNLEVFFRHRPALVHVARRLYDYSENPVSAMHRTLSADDFRQRVALIEYLVSVFASDQAALADLIRTEIPDLLRQFRRQLRRVRPSERDLAQDLFRTELAALRRRGLLRPRRGGVRGLLDYCRGLLMSMGK